MNPQRLPERAKRRGPVVGRAPITLAPDEKSLLREVNWPQATASFSAFITVALIAVLAGTRTGSPVMGLRAIRAFRCIRRIFTPRSGTENSPEPRFIT